MANFVKSTNFTSKDSLPTGDPLKVVKGTEIDVEFNNIATAVASKADSASPTFSGTPFAPTASPGTNTTQLATTAFVHSERSNEATLTNKTLTAAILNTAVLTTPKVDVINENTSGAGVTVDGVLLKDGSVASSALGSGTANSTTFLRGDRTWVAGLGEANVQTFDASGTWTKPIAGTMARIQVWGAGGGGGRTTSTGIAFGGGGGGYNEITVPLSTLASSETVTVGAAGAGRTGSTGNGTAGGNSSFGSLVAAYGGSGGGSSAEGWGGGFESAGAASFFGRPWYETYGDGVNISFKTLKTIWHGGKSCNSVASVPTSPNPDAAYFIEATSVWGGGGGSFASGTTNWIGGPSSFGGAGGNGGRVTTGFDGVTPGGGGGARNNNLDGGNGGSGRVIVTVW